MEKAYRWATRVYIAVLGVFSVLALLVAPLVYWATLRGYISGQVGGKVAFVGVFIIFVVGVKIANAVDNAILNHFRNRSQ